METIEKRYPNLAAQAMEATGMTDPQEAIESLLQAQAAERAQDPTPATDAAIEAIYRELNDQHKAAVKELTLYLMETRQGGKAATE